MGAIYHKHNAHYIIINIFTFFFSIRGFVIVLYNFLMKNESTIKNMQQNIFNVLQEIVL